MRRKKILHITTHFAPFIGGLENMVLQLAKEQSKKYDVSILTCQYNKNLPLSEVIEGIKIYRFPSIEILKNQYSIPKFGFTKKIEKLNPGIIFTHTRFFMTSFLGSLGKEKELWIHIEHGQNFVRSKNFFITFLAWVFDQTFGRYILNKANKIVVLGEKGKQFVEKFQKRRNISIIQNGVKIPQKNKNPPRKNKVIFLGRLIPEKGIKEVLEAAKKCSNWSFDIYGKVPKKGFVILDKHHLKRKGSIGDTLQQRKDNVTFHGEIPPNQISKEIQGSDLVILPSWSEGNSLAILESAANSRPIIATPVGQNEKIISPNFIIPINNVEVLIKKLNKLENRWKTLEKEGASNLKKVKNFYSFKRMIEAYDCLIN